MSDVLVQLVERYPQLRCSMDSIERATTAIGDSLADGGTLLICGNGGSAADAEHIAGELLKGFKHRRPLSTALKETLSKDAPGIELAARLQRGLRAIALTGHVALSTAVTNDLGGQLAFAQQVTALGRPGDSLLAISTSGNAVNVCHAVRVARALGMVSISLTGRDGGRLTPMCDLGIRVAADETYQVQELHLPVYHAICLALEQRFFA